MVKTDIGRHIAERSWFHALCTYLVLFITAKTADSGARICVMAALKPKENHVSDGLPMEAVVSPQILDYVLMMYVLGRVF
jgi:hypothetical protein